jgi:plasmid stabilization system protein ParE
VIGYRFLLPAEEEMPEASLFYEAASTHLGVDFLDDVDHVINLLQNHPMLGQKLENDLRRALLRRFPFNLIYAVETNAIIIVAVAHQSRRPGYWRGRVS